jgi:hypothetical protein
VRIRHVFLLVFGIVFCTCKASIEKPHNETELAFTANGSTEGIYAEFTSIPDGAINLWVQVYLETPYVTEMTSMADINGKDLEQLRKTRKLTCPFVKKDNEYRITIVAVSENESKHFSTTAIANGGIYLKNRPSILWNKGNRVTLSARPVFSEEWLNSPNTTFGYGVYLRNDNGAIGNRSYSSELKFDASKMINEISEISGLTGKLTAFADITVTLEYEKIEWLVGFATTKDVAILL